jgi:threonine/homoserine/homoserine lactone efflux protein
MDAVAPLLLIFGAIVLGAMSPGPSLVYVSRIAMARSRRHAMSAAVGMGVGGVTFAVAAVAGLGAVLHYAEWAYLGLKVVGGAYLLYLGIRMWIGAGHAATAPATRASGGCLRTLGAAALAQLSNPKAVVVYASVFAALLPAQPPLWLYLAIPPGIFAIETGWYLFVAWAFSTSRPRALYARFAAWIDRIAGTVLGGLGAYFAFDGIRAAVR